MIWHSSELMHEVKKQICVFRVIKQLLYFTTVVWHSPELPLKSFGDSSEWESCENSTFSWIIVFPEGSIHANSRQQQQFCDLCFFSKFSFSFKLEFHFVLSTIIHALGELSIGRSTVSACLCHSSLRADSCCPRGSTEPVGPCSKPLQLLCPHLFMPVGPAFAGL